MQRKALQQPIPERLALQRTLVLKLLLHPIPIPPPHIPTKSPEVCIMNSSGKLLGFAIAVLFSPRSLHSVHVFPHYSSSLGRSQSPKYEVISLRSSRLLVHFYCQRNPKSLSLQLQIIVFLPHECVVGGGLGMVSQMWF